MGSGCPAMIYISLIGKQASLSHKTNVSYSFQDYCKKHNKKFNHILDIGAWVGTWSMAMNQYCGRVVAFEPEDCIMNVL